MQKLISSAAHCIHNFIAWCGLALSLIAFFFSVFNGLSEVWAVVVICIALLIVFCIQYREYWESLLKKKGFVKWMVYFLCGIAFICRWFPLIIGAEYEPIYHLGDTGVHYFAAQQLAEGWLEQRIIDYDMVYPQLFFYSWLLSLFVRILGGNIVLAIIGSNVLFDSLSIYFLYLSLKMIKPGSERIGAMLGILNPFSILMCWMPMNMIVTNLLLSIILYLSFRLLRSLKQEPKAAAIGGYTVAIGVSVFISNLIRPVFTVVIIALAIYCCITATKKTLLRNLLVVVVLVLSMTIPTNISRGIVEKQFGDDLLGSHGGWSFYVGSNYEKQGKWNGDDNRYFFRQVLPPNTESISAGHQQIMQEGIQRYIEMGPAKFIRHMCNKVRVLFGEMGEASHDIRQVFDVPKNEWKWQIFLAPVSLYWAFLYGAFFVFMAFNYRQLNCEMFITVLCILGFTAAFLLVEVMSRYSSILSIPLTIICGIQINKTLNRGELQS